MPILKRKPVPEKKLRSELIRVSVTPDELLALATIASGELLTVSTWARRVLMESLTPEARQKGRGK